MKISHVGIAAASAGLLLALNPTAALADQTITSAGPLTSITISSTLNCAVNHVGDTQGEWFGTTACGTLVAAGGHLYGPASIPAGGNATGSAGYVPYTAVNQSKGGSGTESNPFFVNSSVTLGSSGLKLTEQDTYVVGRESYQTEVTISNTTGAAVNAIVYRGGDCFLQDSDVGLGAVQNADAPICKAQPGSADPQRIEGMFPLTGGSRYIEAFYADMWRAIGSKQALPNTCRCNDNIDNGLALSWSVTIPAHGSNTTSSLTIFSPLGATPVTFTKTADEAAAASNGQDGYTVTIRNSGPSPETLQQVVDTLPAGFDYVHGSSSGATTTDPSVSGRTLTWTGTFVVPAQRGGTPGSLHLHFNVTVADEDGTYFNDVTGSGEGVTVVPATHTAPITIGGPTTTPPTSPSSSPSTSPSHSHSHSPTATRTPEPPTSSPPLANTGASVSGQWQLAVGLLVLGLVSLGAANLRLRRGRHQ